MPPALTYTQTCTDLLERNDNSKCAHWIAQTTVHALLYWWWHTCCSNTDAEGLLFYTCLVMLPEAAMQVERFNDSLCACGPVILSISHQPAAY